MKKRKPVNKLIQEFKQSLLEEGFNPEDFEVVDSEKTKKKTNPESFIRIGPIEVGSDSHLLDVETCMYRLLKKFGKQIPNYIG